jgi:hypothetical protein
MNRRILTCTVIFFLGFAAGCKNQPSDQDAVRAGIDKHLSGVAGVNMSAMDKEVKQISVNGDHATAQVEFHAKQGGGTMQMDYTLDRKGGEWTVTSSQPGGGLSPRPGMMPPPPGTGSNPMPQGHPPVN